MYKTATDPNFKERMDSVMMRAAVMISTARIMKVFSVKNADAADVRQKLLLVWPPGGNQ